MSSKFKALGKAADLGMKTFATASAAATVFLLASTSRQVHEILTKDRIKVLREGDEGFDAARGRLEKNQTS